MVSENVNSHDVLLHTCGLAIDGSRRDLSVTAGGGLGSLGATNHVDIATITRIATRVPTPIYIWTSSSDSMAPFVGPLA
jgi:hypothetical protein